jgi:hypothetical protein
VTPGLRRFLAARFLTMLGWVVLLGAGFAIGMAVTSDIGSDALRWVIDLVTLVGTIKLGLILHSRVLAHVDPHGTLRAQIADLGADEPVQGEPAAPRTVAQHPRST